MAEAIAGSQLVIGLGTACAASAAGFGLYLSGFFPGTKPFWLKQLKSDDRDTRLTTALRLGQADSPTALQCLVDGTKHQDLGVRRLSLRGLLQKGDPIALPALDSALIDRDPGIRRLVVEGLRNFKDDRALEMVAPMLKDPDEGVVFAAAETLGALKNPKAVQYLAPGLGGDESLAHASSQALIDIGPAAFDELYRYIPEMLPQARERAIRVFAQLNPADMHEPLMTILKTTREDFVVRAAIVALIEHGGPETTKILIEYVSNDRNPGRPFALRALKKSTDPAIKSLLVRLLSDSDVGIRRAAADALRTNDDPGLIDFLLKGLTDQDSEVAIAMCEALGRLRDSRILPAVFRALWPGDYDKVVGMVKESCRCPLEQIASVEDFYPVIRRISAKEARGSSEQVVRHYLESVVILLEPDMVAGWSELTTTVLVFRHQDFTPEYVKERLHPYALSALRVLHNQKALDRWKAGTASAEED